MEMQPREQAATESPDSGGGEGRPPQVAGAQEARPEDRLTLLLSKIEDLENEIEEVKTAFEIKRLALHRMQLSAALKKNLEKINPQTSVLMDNMKHILKLNKLIMKSQQESWDLEEKLLDVRKKRLQLKQASESKLLEIQTEKNKQKDDLAIMENSDKIKTVQQNLQTEIQVTTVIQHVFQNLILGSKANWAEDSAFKEIVLQLEKNLTMIK
ncbi:centromere protein H isoform X2 [Herpailurus yagouaroundi]|uniref:centromere protein H isoform X2 n=1 Tax=Herpailurus yagouaroundi TaxID=1608482 RepID=UPI000F4213C6|nr:centromere protein H isoform X2 [Puma yagouaroundi]